MRGWSCFAVACIALAWASTASAETQVLREIPFMENLEVRDAVRTQCELDTKVPSFIAQYSSDVSLVDKLTGSRTLELKITEVHAPGGGAFSGPKWMTVVGTLREGGSEIGNFRAKRFSTGGVWGVFRNTCSIIGRTTRALGQDIALWLESPRKDSELGDAR